MITTEKILRQEVKKYIDTADLKLVKMMHAMLEVDADNDLYNSMPNNVKRSYEKSLKQSEKREVISHSEVQKMFLNV